MTPARLEEIRANSERECHGPRRIDTCCDACDLGAVDREDLLDEVDRLRADLAGAVKANNLIHRHLKEANERTERLESELRSANEYIAELDP